MASNLSTLEQDIGNNALQVLVQQFGNPFDFIRELAQNSLDAGSADVDVWTMFHDGEPNGVCEIHVDDNGSGMDEQIIDKSLTRLFSSTKEDDLTSIGKFGIGFVSVFALKPDGVLVKTAKGGERWEVFFDRARNVEKTPLDNPMEGTKITIFKAMSKRDYQDTVYRVFDMLKFWCRYAERRIWFRDAAGLTVLEGSDAESAQLSPRRRRRAKGRIAINEPMTVDGTFAIQVKKGEAEISMAFCDTPQYGFYNHGLTLKETDCIDVLGWAAPFFRNVSFRIKSPHLEHTLTRDTILMNDNYQKALITLVGVARVDLVEQFLNTLERLAAVDPTNGSMSDEYMDGLHLLFTLNREMDPVFTVGEAVQDKLDTAAEKFYRAAAHLFKTDRTPKPDQKSMDASKRKLFRQCHGEPMTLHELQQSMVETDDRLILADRESDMTRELSEFQKPVYFAPSEDDALSFFSKHLGIGSKLSPNENRLFIVGTHAWLSKRLEASDLTAQEQALFEALLKITETSGQILVPVNFLGDNPRHLVLGGVPYDGDTVFKIPVRGPKPPAIAVDVKGTLFQTLSRMLADKTQRDLGLLLAAEAAAEWCGLDLRAERDLLESVKGQLV